MAAIALALLALLALSYREEIRAGYRLRTEFDSVGTNAAGYAEYRHRATGIVFVYLPGGTVEVGTTEEEWRAFLRRAGEELCRENGEAPTDACVEEAAGEIGDEFPRLELHRVRLPPFLIGRFEVTVTEWAAVHGTPPYNSSSHAPSRFRNPVEHRDVSEARAFDAHVELDLPTEEQWEYAARGPGVRRELSSSEIDHIAWHSETAGDVFPVGATEPGAFGLHDVFGNVSEWCLPAAASGLGASALVERGGDVDGGRWLCDPAARFVVTNDTILEPGAIGIRPVVNLYPR